MNWTLLVVAVIAALTVLLSVSMLCNAVVDAARAKALGVDPKQKVTSAGPR